MKPTNATTYQELKDLKESYHGDMIDVKKTLSEIYKQTKKTNGRVTVLETVQTNCPYATGKLFKNGWNIAMFLVALLAAFGSILSAML